MADPKELSDAVWSGDLAAVNACISAGADVNAADAPRFPPLHLAIEQMWVPIVVRLIASGADVDRRLDDGWTPLMHAIDIESDSASQLGKTPDEVTTEMTALLLAAGVIPTLEALELGRRYRNHKAVALLTCRESNVEPK